jgi:hypothetical protein
MFGTHDSVDLLAVFTQRTSIHLWPKPRTPSGRNKLNHSGTSWYYRDSSKGYYPHVKEYPTGWKRVPPVPPPAK